MKYLLLAGCIVLCLTIGFTSSAFTNTESSWFVNLEKPAIYPPTFLFGLVWTILYAMMVYSKMYSKKFMKKITKKNLRS